MTAANISQAEWAEHVELEGRVLGEYGRCANAIQRNTDQLAKLTEEVRQLNRKQRKQDRALESWNDLAEEAKEAELLRLKAQIKRLRGIPAVVFKWAGWISTAILAAIELWKAIH